MAGDQGRPLVATAAAIISVSRQSGDTWDGWAHAGSEATLSGRLRPRRRKAVASSEELKRTLSVLAKPFGAVIGLVLGLIGVVPRAIEGC
jgi:hypothetical protein